MPQPAPKPKISVSTQRPAAPTRRLVWSDLQISDMTSGTWSDTKIQAALSSTDSRGMSPTTYAALRAAKVSGDLLPLLDLLQPPGKKEETQIDQILALLERIAESQARLESRLGDVELKLAAPSSASQQPEEKGQIGSPR